MPSARVRAAKICSFYYIYCHAYANSARKYIAAVARAHTYTHAYHGAVAVGPRDGGERGVRRPDSSACGGLARHRQPRQQRRLCGHAAIPR